HVGLATGHSDEAIRPDRIPDAGIKARRGGERLVDAGHGGIAEHEAGGCGADEEGTAAEGGGHAVRGVHVLIHVGLRSVPVLEAVRMSAAARMIAFWIRE